MPELPDVENYLAALRRFVVGRPLEGILVRSPFLLRTVEPAPGAAVGKVLAGVSRSGKRIVWTFEGGPLFVFHLMIAGRFHWRKAPTKPTRKVDLAAFAFESGTLLLTEAASKKRASLHVVASEQDLAPFDRGGLDVFTCEPAAFAERLARGNHTVKRALTDPTLFDGIGNAYSDEILHAARLSPFARTASLEPESVTRLLEAARAVLGGWIERLAAETGDSFPEKVSAFHPGRAVHGRFGEPCPACGTLVQRIVYASRETNYCPRCQTEGKLLADRALSRLLHDDWPRTIEELEGR